MTIELSGPIEIYFTSENAHDPSALEQCFASNAVVHDEGKMIQGLDAIRDWRTETAKKYNHSVEPISVSNQNGNTIVPFRINQGSGELSPTGAVTNTPTPVCIAWGAKL